MQNLRVIERTLVPVYETSTGEKVVYGTDLHKVLGIKTAYKDWSVRRLADIDVVENEDYEVLLKNEQNSKGGRPSIEHIIKLDTAKEMAMLERNEKGKQVRRYFIQVEKKYKQGVRSGLSQTDYLQLIEMVSSCRDDRFPYIIRILDHMGIHPVWKQTSTDDSSVFGFLKSVDVINRPTNDVYTEYVDFCNADGSSPVSNIAFSKMANRILGLRIIDKKINGRKRRVFVSTIPEGRRF